LALDKSRQTQSFAVFTAGICGNGKLVGSMAQELGRKFPDDTLIQRVFIPLAKAFVALSAGQPQVAIDDAEPAKSFALIYPGAYVQGLAYLQLHDAGRAASAFRRATQSPGGILITTAPFYAQAQLGLARAYAMSGDKADARKAYEAFFTTWKNADADLLVLQAAKKEYAAL
jgi:eukaryotic-like serine/threonine-protein kinase